MCCGDIFKSLSTRCLPQMCNTLALQLSFSIPSSFFRPPPKGGRGGGRDGGGGGPMRSRSAGYESFAARESEYSDPQ